MMSKPLCAAALLAAATLFPATATAQVEKINSTPGGLILQGAKVKAGTDTLYLSGQLASPVDPKKTMAQITSLDDMGDSKAQTISVLNKIKAFLASQGYAMSDLVKLTLYVAADPRTGKMDFAGVNEGFKQFFNTAENPTTVARTTFQVAALVSPYFLIEIDAIAAKK